MTAARMRAGAQVGVLCAAREVGTGTGALSRLTLSYVKPRLKSDLKWPGSSSSARLLQIERGPAGKGVERRDSGRPWHYLVDARSLHYTAAKVRAREDPCRSPPSATPVRHHGLRQSALLPQRERRCVQLLHQTSPAPRRTHRRAHTGPQAAPHPQAAAPGAASSTRINMGRLCIVSYVVYNTKTVRYVLSIPESTANSL
jgi:hypothetical protein